MKKKKTGIRVSPADRIFDILNYVFLTLCLLIVAYPLYFIVIASVSDPTAVYAGKVILWPARFTLEGYQRILDYESFFTGYRNTVIYTVVGTTVNVLITIPGAYALSRKDLVGRNFFMMGNLIVARTFFQQTIPDELLEAATLDGAGNTQFFLRVVLPLSKSIIAVMVLFYAVNHWNSYFNALIYLKSAEKYPLQLVLRNILFENSLGDMVEDASTLALQQRLGDLIKYGIIIASSLPLLILYPFLQRFFIQGVMIGAVKG